jgi:hypothetical protein
VMDTTGGRGARFPGLTDAFRILFVEDAKSVCESGHRV